MLMRGAVEVSEVWLEWSDHSLHLFTGEPFLVSLVEAAEVLQTDSLLLRHMKYTQVEMERVHKR